jgi:hypothetical protein
MQFDIQACFIIIVRVDKVEYFLGISKYEKKLVKFDFDWNFLYKIDILPQFKMI